MSQVPETVCYSMEDMQDLARQNNAAKLEALPKAKAILSKYEEQLLKIWHSGRHFRRLRHCQKGRRRHWDRRMLTVWYISLSVRRKRTVMLMNLCNLQKFLNKIVEVEV